MADIGVWMAASTLEHKLETASKSGEATWNVRRMPKRLVQEPPPHRLFVASEGCWRGYFRLIPEVLFNPEDEQAPYTLIFDTRSWVEIPVEFLAEPDAGRGRPCPRLREIRRVSPRQLNATQRCPALAQDCLPRSGWHVRASLKRASLM